MESKNNKHKQTNFFDFFVAYSTATHTHVTHMCVLSEYELATRSAKCDKFSSPRGCGIPNVFLRQLETALTFGCINTTQKQYFSSILSTFSNRLIIQDKQQTSCLIFYLGLLFHYTIHQTTRSILCCASCTWKTIPYGFPC